MTLTAWELANKKKNSMIKEISGNEFEKEVKKSSIPAVVDFWAEWCTPCKMFAPAFEAVSKKLEGGIKFLKVNVDENNDLASAEGVMSIPTIILYKNGDETGRFTGAKTEREFEEFLKKA